MFPTLGRVPAMGRLFWITVLREYPPKFLVRMLFPLIPVRTQSNRWRQKGRTMFPVPHPLHRSRARPRRHPLLPRDRMASRLQRQRPPCRGHVPHPPWRRKVHTMFLLRHPLHRSRARPRRHPLLPGDRMAFHLRLQRRLSREHMQHPLWRRKAHIMFRLPHRLRRSRIRPTRPPLLHGDRMASHRRLLPGHGRVLPHSLRKEGDRITLFPMLAQPHRP
jgi:hypothetical protein